MSSKQLKTNAIVNELKDSSLFFAPSEHSVKREPLPNNALQAPATPLPAAQDVHTELRSTLPRSTPQVVLQRPTHGVEPDSPVLSHSTANEVSSFHSSPSTFVHRKIESLPLPEPAVVTNAQTNERMKERPNDRTDERRNESTKVRHSFDVRSDQLLTLREIAVVRERALGKKVLLGELVQEALDLFIAQERATE